MAEVIKKAVLAGILVGIGVMINISVDNRYVGALLFSFALLTIIKCELNLYTGKIGFYWSQKPKELVVILLFNLAGVVIPTLGVAVCRKEAYTAIIETSAVKFGHTFTELFVYGVFCGVLMYVASYAKDTVITIFCIMIFILSGYEHCIADFIYLVLNFSVAHLMKFAVILLGNSAGSIATNFLMETKKA